MAPLPSSSAHHTRAPIPPNCRKLYRVRQRHDRNGNPHLSSPRPLCPCCGKAFVTPKACHQHMALKPECRAAEKRALERYYQERLTTGIGGMRFLVD